jgi:hypothetical protein
MLVVRPTHIHTVGGRACAQELAEKSAHWAERLTSDFEAKDAELKALTATRERDLERLQELQARFDRDVADRAAREVRAVRHRE